VLKVGDPAPALKAVTSDGKTVDLAALRGKRVVLFFFPKAFTRGCTIETRRFRDHYSELAALGAEIVGVSVDSAERQCEFASAEGVPFPMLGDASRSISRSFDVLRPILGVSQRVTYVIGPEGRIEAAFHHELLVNRHLEDVKEHLARAARPRP
jgi:peroxiredoxin Q/BCP